MLAEIFYWVINASIIASAIGVIILALRKIGRIPRFAIYFLWIIPLLRFWIPFGFVNQYSFLNIISKFTTKTVELHGIMPAFSVSNFLMSADNYFPIKYKTELLKNVFTIAAGIWIVVAMAAILTSIALYFLTKNELRSALLIKDNIYSSEKIISPAVYGIFHPKIILPIKITGNAFDYIIMHENVHIHRKDNLLRVVAVITACVHWFNPLSWIFLKNFLCDMELACDDKVLKNLNKTQVSEYAFTILDCASGKSFYASAFGGSKTKIRVENVLSYKKLTLLSSVFLTLLVIIIVLVFITNASL